ncbi:hypothetical protein QFW82_01880 [Streptomyces malaysiensis subsp. malaysiensis]|uniref:hypothetical protein n=1 Tax=Streptomyces malaysiensis TaxID=92644 RepID=UPI0024BFD412|nr:hypothetical protein [Streptomyces sp. NA07423]WHX15844.1 hypothetical protein QFW82_01880 [Streptomyces sp. NA07423]
MLTLRRLGWLGGAVVGSGVVLVLLLDGPEAAGALVALLTAVALLVARYAAGAGALDSGQRHEVWLLRTRVPGMGEWRRNVRTSTGPDGALYYRAVLRPELRRLYAAALTEHHHVSLDQHPEKAAELIGPELWPWLGFETPRTGPDGEIPVDVLRRLVDRLETLSAPRSPHPYPRSPRTGKDEAT